MRRVVLLLAMVLAAALAPAAPAAGRRGEARLVRLTSTPALYPAYSPAIHDYVVRCDPSTPVRVSTWAAAGTAASIDGRRGPRASVRLAAGQALVVEGRHGAATTSYHVRCLPRDFPAWTETRTAATDDWYVLTPSLSLGPGRSRYVAVFDGHGVPVWWYRASGNPIDAKLLPGPVLAWSLFLGSPPAYQLKHLDGTSAGVVTSPDGEIDDHELQRAANGDDVYLVYALKPHVDLSEMGGPADATVLEARIEEIAPDGRLVWSWSTDGHVDLAEASRWYATILQQPVDLHGEPAYDVFHANAVSLDGGTVLLSLRQTDGVYAIDRATGSVLWKLGGTRTAQSLTVVGDPYGQVPFGGQHDVRLLRDGTISVFEDGTLLGRPPRAVRYRIDPVARTATLLEQVTDPNVTASLCCGSARRLPGGDWVISWGGDSVVGEYRPDGTPVFTLDFPGLFSYRAVPVAASRLSIVALRAGMDAMASR